MHRTSRLIANCRRPPCSRVIHSGPGRGGGPGRVSAVGLKERGLGETSLGSRVAEPDHARESVHGVDESLSSFFALSRQARAHTYTATQVCIQALLLGVLCTAPWKPGSDRHSGHLLEPQLDDTDLEVSTAKTSCRGRALKTSPSTTE